MNTAQPKRRFKFSIGKRLALATCLLLLLSVVGVFLSLAAFQVPAASVLYNGTVQLGFNIYRCLNGDYLVSLRETRIGLAGTYNTLYALRPREHKVAFVVGCLPVAPGVICLKGYSPPSVLLGPGKAGVPLPTMCRVGDFRFVTMLSHAQVRATW